MSATPDPAPDPSATTLVLCGAAAVLRRTGSPERPLQRLDAALLAVLAIEGATSRQRLLQLLWPDQPSEPARNALRQRLFRLRRAAGIELVCGSERLALAEGVAHDLGDADAGPLLAGADYADCPEFDDWLAEQRRALVERRRSHRRERIAACLADGRYPEGAALAERDAADDPLDEAAARQAMKLHYLAGQRSAALAAYERFAAALAADDPRLRPARDTIELLATIRDAQPPPPSAHRHEIPAAVLRPPRLVGRDQPLQALALAWSAGRTFWLLGEAGLGKSRLIAEFVGAPSDGAASAALVVAARPGDVGVPYATLGRALRALLERRPALLDEVPRGELARVMPELPVAAPARNAPGTQLALARAVAALLQDAPRHGIAALVIDDLHFADAASVEMLGSLVGDDALGALRWGFAQRPAEGCDAVDALRAALDESQRLDTVVLAPLDEAQMAELVASLAVPGLDAAKLAPQLVRHTGGNPLFALETLKHLIASGPGPDAGLPRPLGVGQLIERRLRQLPPQTLALARVAAIAGIDFSIELAQAVLATRALALADAWRELEAAQVLRGNAFAHDLVYEATLASVPAPIAAHTHGEVAAFLEARGGEPARVAAHWIAAEQPGRALTALHAAAEAAKRAMRPKEQAAFLDQAAQIESTAGDHAAAFASLQLMIESSLTADLMSVDAALFDRLDAEAATDVQRAQALAARANWLLERGELDRAQSQARGAVDLADAAGDDATAAYARQRLGQILDWQGDYGAAVGVYQQLLPWAAERADVMARAMLYSRLAVALDNCDRGREARVYHQRTTEALRGLQEWGLLVVTLENLATSWAMAGYTLRALEVLREALQLAAAHDEVHVAGASLPASMYKRLRDCGRYDEALRWLEPALGAGPTMFSALSRCHVAWGWIHLGQHARAQREIDLALAAEMPEWVRAKALQMRARLKFALGQRAGGLLEEALRIARAQTGRLYLLASVVLDHGLTIEPADALAAARQVVADGERCDLPGTTLAGHVRAMRFAVEARRPDAAAAHAAAALAVGDDVTPNDLYPAERWLNAWRAYTLAGEAAAAADALRRGVEWVRTTQRDHVPEPFRDSFVRANAVNQQLLRAASRPPIE